MRFREIFMLVFFCFKSYYLVFLFVKIFLFTKIFRFNIKSIFSLIFFISENTKFEFEYTSLLLY